MHAIAVVLYSINVICFLSMRLASALRANRAAINSSTWIYICICKGISSSDHWPLDLLKALSHPQPVSDMSEWIMSRSPCDTSITFIAPEILYYHFMAVRACCEKVIMLALIFFQPLNSIIFPFVCTLLGPAKPFEKKRLSYQWISQAPLYQIVRYEWVFSPKLLILLFSPISLTVILFDFISNIR